MRALFQLLILEFLKKSENLLPKEQQMNLNDIKNDTALLNAIDWDMTHEDAVRLYLEWGCNWARSNYVIRSKDDMSHYFVINTWKKKPVVYFIKRNSDEAVELAEFNMPEKLEHEFMDSVGHHKGVYSIDGKVKTWLKEQLNA